MNETHSSLGVRWMCRSAVFSIAFAALCGATSAFADDIYWKAAVDGLWSNPDCWNLTPSRVPADGDNIRINSGGAYTVSMPQSDLVLRPTSFRLTAGNNSAITVDGRGGSFTMPACEVDTYANEPWGISASKGHFFNLETYNIANSKKHAVVAMTNAYFTVSCTNHDARLDIWDGYFNFYDPSGEAYSHPFTTAAYAQRDLEIHIHPNAHLRLPVLNFRANATRTNLIAFHGGDSEVKGSLAIPSGNFAHTTVTTGELCATEGALLSLNNVSIGGTVSGNTSSNRTARITVEKNSEVTLSGALGQSTASRLQVYVTSGASLKCNSTFGVARGTMTTADVQVVDANFQVANSTTLGMAGTYAEFYATNSTLTFHDLNLAECLFTAKDSTTTISHFYPGYQGTVGTTFGEAIFDGGTVNLGVVYCGLNCDGAATFRNGAKVTASGGEFYIGKDTTSHSVMTIEDDDTAMSAKATSSGKQVYVGYNGHGTLYMKGGTLTVPSNGIFLGDGAASTGVVVQTGGDVTIQGSEGLLIGHLGHAEYTITDGTITTPRIRLSWQGTAAVPTNVMRIAGGFVSVTTVDGNMGVNVCDSQNTKCKLVLEGGVLQSHRVRGWTGASVKGGGGWAVLEADGGTIRAHTTSAGFVETFDEALVGAKGLTLASDFSVTIPQGFTDKPGEAGRLVLTGSAVKTLTATNSAESVMEVVGGTALFAANASHHSYVVVTNTGTLSFAGGSTGTTFKGLALGAEDSMGILEMDLSDRVELEAVPVFGRFGFAIADESYSVGSYPLIVCDGEASAATIAAWGDGYVMRGRKEGLSYAFTAAYDSTEDKTTFSLVITEGSGITSSSVWTGPGSAWADNDNWDAAAPTAASAAVFSSESAPAEVNVVGEQTVGALDFTASKSYTIGGSGSINISDNGSPRVTATAGSSAVNVGMMLPTLIEFDVADPAALTLGGPLSRGGVLKKGTGRLYLGSANNLLNMGIFVSEGLLSIASMAAAGMNNSVFKQVTIDGGTFEFGGGASGAVPFSIIVQADSQEAVGLKNDADITIGSISVLSGDIVKRGAGTLTFDTALATLSADNGKCSLNSTHATGQQFFPSNGVMPTAGYCGFNVIDGEVVFKTGTYSLPNAIAVGLVTRDASDAEPAFTVDGARVETGTGSYHFLLGANAYNGRSKFTRPRLTVKNGGYLSANTLNVGRNGDYDIYPEILLDNGTIYGSWAINISERAGTHATFTIRNGSKLLSNTTANWRGPADLTFTDSVFARNTSLETVGINAEQYCLGTWLFGANSTFYCSGITQKTQRTVTFAFAGGRWVASKSGNADFLFQGSDRLTIETRQEKGLYMNPVANKEYRIAKAITGAGGVVMDGAGTLRFVTQEIIQTSNGEPVTNKIGAAGTVAAITNPCTLDFAGPMDIASGSVVIEEGAVRTNAVFTGAGTLSAVNCPTPKFLLPVEDDYTAERVLTFNGFSTAGGATVDLGRTAEDPLPRPFREIVVAHYVGDAPDVSGWKAVGHGQPMVTGAFRAADGDVILTLRTSGTVMMFK